MACNAITFLVLPVVFTEYNELEEDHGIEQGELTKDCLISLSSIITLIPEDKRTLVNTCEGSEWLVDLYIEDILALMEIAEIGE